MSPLSAGTGIASAAAPEIGGAMNSSSQTAEQQFDQANMTLIGEALKRRDDSVHRNSGTYNGDRPSLLARHRDDLIADNAEHVEVEFPVQDLHGSSTEKPPYFDIHSNRSEFAGRSRSRSINEAGEEVIRQLAPPVSVPLVGFCLAWYATSAMSNTLNKTILMHFPYAVTLSMVQFVLAAFFGAFTLIAAQNVWFFYRLLPRGLVTSAGIRFPTREILIATSPMGAFQLVGHIFSHMSTQRIPLSLVHTVKALSPLFTVAAYRLIFSVTYSPSTYLSLVPLTIGVIMTCASGFEAHFVGLLYALVAALIFVSQNMFSKTLLTTGSTANNAESVKSAPKLDKLNVLCYCSSLAFIFTFPLWVVSEGSTIVFDYMAGKGAFFGNHPASHEMTEVDDYTGFQLLGLFVMNGAVHFLQNLLAFQVLGMVSPVTYSVASLIKRIVVITVAIFWFGQQVTPIQGWGILLTFLGLYLYDRCGGDKHKSEREETKKGVLPK